MTFVQMVCAFKPVYVSASCPMFSLFRARVPPPLLPASRAFRSRLLATITPLNAHGRCPDQSELSSSVKLQSSERQLGSAVFKLKVLDPILWSNHNYSTPLQPNHRRHTFTTAAAVCLGCGLSLNITCETYNLHWALRVTCTIEMFVTPSSTHVVLFIH